MGRKVGKSGQKWVEGVNTHIYIFKKWVFLPTFTIFCPLLEKKMGMKKW